MGISGCNWSDLPIDIFKDLLTELPDIEDFIRFGAVCRSWRSASIESKKMNRKGFFPWMMLSEPEPPENFLEDETLMLINMFNQEEKKEEESKNEDKDDVPLPRKFLSVLSDDTINIYLPEAQGRRCFGSKFGWILTLGLDLNIHLLNPLTRLQISLPPQPTFPTQFYDSPYEESSDEEPYDPFDGEGEAGYLRGTYIQKFALSAHPNHRNGCVAMVIYSRERILAFASPGDTAWTDVKCHLGWFDDVIFFNNTFYAIPHRGNLVVCDITSPVPVATDFMPPPPRPTRRTHRYYLVEMSGHLHVVVRIYKSGDYFCFTVEFKVYRLDFRREKWVKLKILGRHALFIGNNASFAVSQPDLPSNCIFFTDDFIDYYLKGTCDMGLYHFGAKKIVDNLYSSNCADCVRSRFCTPLFFIPNLH